MKVSEILLKAAEAIEKRGHTKHVLENNEGSLCINGAILVAMGSEHPAQDYSVINAHDNARLFNKAGMIVNETLGHPGDIYSHIDWNNDPKRTGQEVIDILKKSAAKAEELEIA